jgi:hypothetical protein
MRTGAAAARHPDWREALAELTRQIPLLAAEDQVHLALLFASAEYRPEFGAGGRAAGSPAPACPGLFRPGVIGPRKEIEGEPAGVTGLLLPEAELTAVHLTQEDLERCRTPRIGIGSPARAGGTSAWLLFADPFTMDAEARWTACPQATRPCWGGSPGDLECAALTCS